MTLNLGFVTNLIKVTNFLCLQLWMESEESAIRSCPLCQLTFPTGYPDDALIKHIDSHLENSKIWPFFKKKQKKPKQNKKKNFTLTKLKLFIFYWSFSNQAVVWWVCMIIFKELYLSHRSFLVSNLQQCSSSTALFQFSSHNTCVRDVFAYFGDRDEMEWTHMCSVTHTRVIFMSCSCHASQHLYVSRWFVMDLNQATKASLEHFTDENDLLSP